MKKFSRSQIEEIAKDILIITDEATVRSRIYRNILRQVPPGDDPLPQPHLNEHPQVKRLLEEQQPDGSWGRLHSEDTSKKQSIPTTEFGVQRGIALGLPFDHIILKKAAEHLGHLLDGQFPCPDPAEKNDRWPTGVRLFTAATLAQIEPHHTEVRQTWALWLEIAKHAFSGGRYDPLAEIAAHRDLTGASAAESYLILNNKYSLILLSTFPDDIPDTLEHLLFKWLCTEKKWIHYLDAPLMQSPHLQAPTAVDHWFTSLEILSRFRSWKTLYGMEMLNWLWEKRGENNRWDFGSRPTRTPFLPISCSWRKKAARETDWTLRTISLLK
jgi:hypothetical protein